MLQLNVLKAKLFCKKIVCSGIENFKDQAIMNNVYIRFN